MITTREIKDTWKSQLVMLRQKTDPRASVQVRVDAVELKQVLDESCPENLNALHSSLSGDRPVTHALLWPEEVEQLITYAPRRETNPVANV